MKHFRVLSVGLLGVMLGLGLASVRALAEDSAPPEKGEKLNVDAIKQKYWAKGSEAQMAVVQNRLYSKENRIELSLFGGTFSNDPFLTTKLVGGELGYHFSEYIGIHAFFWNLLPKKSSAASDFLKFAKIEANTNDPKAFYGTEMTASLLYGKLSLLGQSIIYYDMHLSFGAGMMDTDSGTYLAPVFGLGQEIYLNQWSALRVAYRLTYHSERLTGLANKRSVWTDAFQVGVSFFIL